MIERKKKLRIIQLILLISGVVIIYLTYYDKGLIKDGATVIVNESFEEKMPERNENDDTKDIFFNVEYTGLDLNGNRYLLKSKEAYLDKLKPEIVNMNNVKAKFYFKDNTILFIRSAEAIYNNKNLDMSFKRDVEAKYLKSDLFADNAEYSNSGNYLSIYGNVRLDDIKGNLVADKLLFDITKQKLNITSFNNGKINAKVKLNEKRF